MGTSNLHLQIISIPLISPPFNQKSSPIPTITVPETGETIGHIFLIVGSIFMEELIRMERL
jgi:hypothetical protein